MLGSIGDFPESATILPASRSSYATIAMAGADRFSSEGQSKADRVWDIPLSVSLDVTRYGLKQG
jgi:hypothetical protein